MIELRYIFQTAVKHRFPVTVASFPVNRTTAYRSISLTHRIQGITRCDHEMLSLLQYLHERSIKFKYVILRTKEPRIAVV